MLILTDKTHHGDGATALQGDIGRRRATLGGAGRAEEQALPRLLSAGHASWLLLSSGPASSSVPVGTGQLR